MPADPCPPSPALPALSRHAEVQQALHDPRLVPPGQGDAGDQAHQAVRAAALQLQAPARLAAWRDAFAAQARTLVNALPDATPVDLVAAYAEPWSLRVALQVTGLAPELAHEAAALARQVFDTAAAATDGTPGPAALQAATALARLLADPVATPPLTPSGPGGTADVQTFVALSQSLPALLAGAWQALLAQPDVLHAWLADPQAVWQGLDELLRLGGPAQAVFREAREDLLVQARPVRRGERVAILLGQANLDATAFADPLRLDPARPAAAMLSLGAGPHRCAGQALVRLALGVATEALLSRCGSLALVHSPSPQPAWRGGFALRAPATLWVLRQPRDGAAYTCSAASA